MILRIQDDDDNEYKINLKQKKLKSGDEFFGTGLDNNGNKIEVGCQRKRHQVYITDDDLTLIGNIMNPTEDIVDQMNKYFDQHPD